MSRAWVDIIRESKTCRLHVPKRLRRQGKLQIMIAPQNVCYWPKADIPRKTLSPNVALAPLRSTY